MNGCLLHLQKVVSLELEKRRKFDWINLLEVHAPMFVTYETCLMLTH